MRRERAREGEGGDLLNYLFIFLARYDMKNSADKKVVIDFTRGVEFLSLILSNIFLFKD